jgi:ureidoacrylate peracid hydrolase
MHPVSIRQEIVNRVTARRGRYHLFDTLDAKTTAFVVIDMQPTFVAEKSPAEVPLSRAIVPNINRLADEMRQRGGTVIWVTHANVRTEQGSDWNGFYERFVAASVREKTIEMNAPRPPLEALWHELTPAPQDLHVVKNRYSALISGASQLERLLRSLGIETLLIAGTKTNVCCESTGRDAMMLDFNVVMVSDCLAALSDEEHLATLETFIQQFGDVMTSTEVAAILR